MKILHLCWGLEPTNGAANVARFFVGEQRAAGHEAELVSRPTWTQLRAADQIWFHCGWYWVFWLVALCQFCHRSSWSPSLGKSARRSSASKDEASGLRHADGEKNRIFCWMTHGCYDPVRLAYHGWKKLLVAPIERWALLRCDRLVATCPTEAEWIRAWLHLTDSRRTSSSGRPLRREPEIEIIDLRRFFNLDATSPGDAVSSLHPETGTIHPADAVSSLHPETGTIHPVDAVSSDLHVLYLGRRHPLKGVEFLERAVEELNRLPSPAFSTCSLKFTLRIVSDHTGEALERDWAWCDVLCLPTLSENFGLVVAEALARGKRAVTTDGAPAWDPSVTGTDYGGRLVYLKGYRDAMPKERIALLSAQLRTCAAEFDIM